MCATSVPFVPHDLVLNVDQRPDAVLADGLQRLLGC